MRTLKPAGIAPRAGHAPHDVPVTADAGRRRVLAGGAALAGGVSFTTGIPFTGIPFTGSAAFTGGAALVTAPWPLRTASAAAPAGDPRRIVIVGGALTEIAWALDAGDRVVGVDTTSTHPPQVTKLPSVGYARALSTEGILALAPDLLLVTEDAGPPAVIDQIRQTGIAVERLAANHRFEGLIERVDGAGALIGRPDRAAALAARLEAEWRAARQGIAPRADGPLRVCFVLAHNPAQLMVSGRGTAADAMIAYAGARNAVDGFHGTRPLSPEVALAMRPDVLLFTDQGLAAAGGAGAVAALPGLSLVPAARRQRIASLEASWLLGFGPRLPAALTELDRQLNDAARRAA